MVYKAQNGTHPQHTALKKKKHCSTQIHFSMHKKNATLGINLQHSVMLEWKNFETSNKLKLKNNQTTKLYFVI